MTRQTRGSFLCGVSVFEIIKEGAFLRLKLGIRGNRHVPDCKDRREVVLVLRVFHSVTDGGVSVYRRGGRVERSFPMTLYLRSIF